METALSSIIGHEDALAQVTAALRSGRMPHAWLLCGIEGIGKAALAQHIAAYILSGSMREDGGYDPQSRGARLVAASSHPDLLMMRRREDPKSGEMRDIIPVDDALKLAGFLRLTPAEAGWRVAIIDEAHCLNRNGQNAILKIIEEPPQRSLILMTVTTPGALLPTIRSRCRVLSLAPLPDREVKLLLRRMHPVLEEDALTRITALAQGSIGFADKIVQAGILPMFEDIAPMLAGQAQYDRNRIMKLAEQAGRKGDSHKIYVLIELIINALARHAIASARAGKDAVSAQFWQAWQQARTVFTMTDASNLDIRLGFMRAMDDIAAAIA